MEVLRCIKTIRKEATMFAKIRSYLCPPRSGNISDFYILKARRLKKNLEPDEKIVVDDGLMFADKKTRWEKLVSRLFGRFLQ
jgi:hypothetical protein